MRETHKHVRTTANVADEPSRVDMRGAIYELGDDVPAEVAARLQSVPVDCVLPAIGTWSRPAWAWVDRAAASA